MLDFWLKLIGSIAARLLQGTQKDVTKKEQIVAVEEQHTKVAKVILNQAKARKTRASKIAKSLLD